MLTPEGECLMLTRYNLDVHQVRERLGKNLSEIIFLIWQVYVFIILP